MSIKHLEDLNPQELLTFLVEWNRDSKVFHATEKVDGNFFAFGLKDNVFYIKTKTQLYDKSEQIPNLFFMQPFKKYFEALKDVPLSQIIKRLGNKYNYAFDGRIEITGEAVPSHDHNIVIYDKKKIGDGIMVIFDISTKNEEKIPNKDLWEELAHDINQYTNIKLHAIPKVNLTGFKFKRIIESELRKIVSMKGILETPARTPESKKLKEKLLEDCKKLGLQAKEQMLQFQYKPSFGDEYEGIVITCPTGKNIKIIDKNKFTKRKEDNWIYINKLMAAQNDFKKNIKHFPFDLGPWLDLWKSEIDKIENQFIKEIKDNTITITIPKKIIETKNSIVLDYDRINILKDLLYKDKLSPLEIRDMFLNKKIVPK